MTFDPRQQPTEEMFFFLRFNKFKSKKTEKRKRQEVMGLL